MIKYFKARLGYEAQGLDTSFKVLTQTQGLDKKLKVWT